MKHTMYIMIYDISSYLFNVKNLPPPGCGCSGGNESKGIQSSIGEARLDLVAVQGAR